MSTIPSRPVRHEHEIVSDVCRPPQIFVVANDLDQYHHYNDSHLLCGLTVFYCESMAQAIADMNNNIMYGSSAIVVDARGEE
jgi:hypothetical protein